MFILLILYAARRSFLNNGISMQFVQSTSMPNPFFGIVYQLRGNIISASPTSHSFDSSIVDDSFVVNSVMVLSGKYCCELLLGSVTEKWVILEFLEFRRRKQI